MSLRSVAAVGAEVINTMPFPDWLLPSSPFILAVIAGGVTLLVRKIRGPVAVQDLWAENRLLRKEMQEIRDQVMKMQLTYETERRAQSQRDQTMNSGFIALSNFVERSHTGRAKPQFTAEEERAINAARDLLGEDEWPTINPVAGIG